MYYITTNTIKKYNSVSIRANNYNTYLTRIKQDTLNPNIVTFNKMEKQEIKS